AFYRSEDQGESWKRLSGGLPEHFKAASRAVAGDPEEPSGFLFGMTDGSVWLTEDSGESFRRLLAGMPQIMSLRVAYR
ncbi:MAG: exo-alpha-sialidase, partial [Candidatus Binatia bacterium]